MCSSNFLYFRWNVLTCYRLIGHTVGLVYLTAWTPYRSDGHSIIGSGNKGFHQDYSVKAHWFANHFALCKWNSYLIRHLSAPAQWGGVWQKVTCDWLTGHVRRCGQPASTRIVVDEALPHRHDATCPGWVCEINWGIAAYYRLLWPTQQF